MDKRTLDDIAKERLFLGLPSLAVGFEDDDLLYEAARPPLPNRVTMLEEAIRLTQGDRQAEYGSFQRNMDDLACMMQAYICAKYGGKSVEITSTDAAFFMALSKMVRTFQEIGNPKADTYTDGAWYFAMAGEAAFFDAKEKT